MKTKLSFYICYIVSLLLPKSMVFSRQEAGLDSDRQYGFRAITSKSSDPLQATIESSAQKEKEKVRKDKKKRLIIKCVVIGGITILLLVVYLILRKYEDRMIFPGAYAPYHKKEKGNLQNMKSFRGRRRYKLHYLCGKKSEEAPNGEPVVLFFPGSDFFTLDSVFFEKLYKKLSISPKNLVLATYPGYGKNGKSRLGSDREVYDFAEDIVKQLVEVEGYKKENMIIIGHSLGGALACYLGAKDKYKKIITLATFTSVRDRARKISPILSRLMTYHLNNMGWMRELKSPWEGLHGSHDDNIPASSVKDLYENLPDYIKAESKYTVQNNATHSGIVNYLSSDLLANNHLKK